MEGLENHLPKLNYAYNSTIKKVTRFTPFYLMFGRLPRPIDSTFKDTSCDPLPNLCHEAFVTKWKNTIKDARKILPQNQMSEENVIKNFVTKTLLGKTLFLWRGFY